MAPHSSTLAWKSHGRKSLEGWSPWGRWGSGTAERLHFHFPALEKEMATHSSVLAWRIPGTGEPGGLPSMGSHRVGHDWSDLAAAAATSVHLHNNSVNHVQLSKACKILILKMQKPRFRKVRLPKVSISPSRKVRIWTPVCLTPESWFSVAIISVFLQRKKLCPSGFPKRWCESPGHPQQKILPLLLSLIFVVIDF